MCAPCVRHTVCRSRVRPHYIDVVYLADTATGQGHARAMCAQPGPPTRDAASRSITRTIRFSNVYLSRFSYALAHPATVCRRSSVVPATCGSTCNSSNHVRVITGFHIALPQALHLVQATSAFRSSLLKQNQPRLTKVLLSLSVLPALVLALQPLASWPTSPPVQSCFWQVRWFNKQG